MKLNGDLEQAHQDWINKFGDEQQGDIILDYDLISNMSFSGIDYKDYPDFCDAYIDSADYDNEPMTEKQLELLDDEWVYEQILAHATGQ